MPARENTPAFTAVRNLSVSLNDRDRATLAQIFGATTERQGKLGPAVRDALRAIAELEDETSSGWSAGSACTSTGGGRCRRQRG